MPTTVSHVNNALIVPYGSLTVRAEVLELMRAGQIDDLERPGAPVVVIDTTVRQPLRMHDLEHPFTLPPIAQDLAHAQTQLAFLEQHLVRHCGDWAKTSQAFITSYFADLRAAVHSNEAALVVKAGALSGLLEIEHWCFSALMPLPRAHLYLPSSPPNSMPNSVSAKNRASEIQATDFVMVDFAFWSGAELVAVVIDNGNSPTGARKKALGSLAAHNIKLKTISMDVVRSEKPLAVLKALGSDFESFWSDLPLARSPFRGRGIDAPVQTN